MLTVSGHAITVRAHPRRGLGRLVAIGAAAALALAPMPAPTLAASPNPALAPASGDWPQYGHDAAHTGDNPVEKTISAANVANLKLAWTASTRQGIRGFVVAEGVVFVSGGNGGTGKLYEYPVGCASGGEDCAPRWTVTVSSSSITGPAVADGVVYVGSSDGKLYAYAVGCASGGGVCSPLWTATMSGSLTAAPAVAGGLVYAEPDNDDRLYVYRVGCASGGGTCTPLSIVVLADRNPFNSPVVSNGVVYATPTTGGLHAYPVSCFSGGATCSPLLTADAETSPAVADGILHVGWGTYQTDTKTYGVIYAYGVGCATGGATCKPLWDDLAGSVIDSPPSVANGVVYAGSRDGTIQAFAESGCASDAGLWVGERTCLPLWSATTSGGIYSSPVVSNGVVYVVATNDGNLYAFSLSGATPPATSTAMPPSSNEPGAPIWSLVLGLAAFFGGTLLTLSRRQRPTR